jgi:hypothetical protein
MKTLRQRALPCCAVAIAVLFTIMSGSARSQSDLEEALKQYGAEDVRGYIKPMADLFGANMNSGFYHSADIPVAGFSFSLEILGMGAVVGDEQKSYDAKTPPGFTPATFRTATVFGGTGTTVSDANNPSLQYRGSDGIINATLFPLAVPQIRVGLIGTEATIRFITSPSIDAFPKTTLVGVGARHNIGQYIPTLGFDIAAGVFYNKFTVGDIVDFNSIAIGAQAGKSFSVLSIYGGLQYEKSTMNIAYTSSNPLAAPVVDIDIGGDNTFRFTAGAGLNLAFFHIFADANFGSITNFSGGIGFGF